MQTQTIQTYSFNELSEKAKNAALNKYRDWLTSSWNPNGWAEYVLDDEQTKLKEYGYDGAQISFSGFYSQGDGANFTASVNIETWLRAHKLSNKYRALYSFSKQYDIPTKLYKASHHYEHEHTITIETEDTMNMPDKAAIQLTEVERLILDDARAYMKRIYKAIETEYDYLTSDEALTENFLENDYQFTENGEMWN